MIAATVYTDRQTEISIDGRVAALVTPCVGAIDTFTHINEIAVRWHRHTATPVTEMKMELIVPDVVSFYMVPSVSYNGNGWGDTEEYVGDNCDGTPWTYASHRVTIPSCTYTETEFASLALMAEAGDNTACSVFASHDGTHHQVLFPEVEGPKTLQRHFWGEPFVGTMEPRSDFDAIILIYPAENKPIRYDRMLDFAWRYYGHPIKAPRSPEELYRLGMAYTRFLYQEEQNGFCGFTMGSQWHMDDWIYKKTSHRYEISWVGQSAVMANEMLRDYLRTGNKQSLEMGIKAHDCWLKFGSNPCGLLDAQIDFHPWRKMEYPSTYVPDKWKLGEAEYESHRNRVGKTFQRDENGLILLNIDSCNNGGAAEAYFEAFELARKCGYERPEYLKTAMGICDFAIKTQADEGRYAKSWTKEGNVKVADGTIGAFLIAPMFTAYKYTGDGKYIASATKAFEFYYRSLEEDGFTTAGALDTYCIDKESSSPLLRAALLLYEHTRENRYLEAAKNIAWYLSTWLMHYTIKYPLDCLISQMGYDTFGSTSVSTAHQAMDQYALRDVISFLKLANYTGNIQWREKAIAFWCNACQGISDGTMFLNGRMRPAGSQDEAIFHTRWGRHGVGPFRPSQWLPAWPTAFRFEILNQWEDKEIFREGLTEISGKIEH